MLGQVLKSAMFSSSFKQKEVRKDLLIESDIPVICCEAMGGASGR